MVVGKKIVVAGEILQAGPYLPQIGVAGLACDVMILFFRE